MSALEKCAEALLHQKAVQASNHEHLERQVLDLERNKRTTVFQLKQRVSDVERRRRDVEDLCESNRRLEGQLAQGKLKLSALLLRQAEAKSRAAQVTQTLEECEKQWTGYPARAVQLVRALQERHSCVKDARQLRAVLEVAMGVMRCIREAECVQTEGRRRVERQEAHLAAFNAALQERLAAAERLHGQILSSKEVVQAAQEQCVADLQHVEQMLLCLSAQSEKQSRMREALEERRTCALNAITAVGEDMASREAILQGQQEEKERLLSELQQAITQREELLAQQVRENADHKTAHASHVRDVEALRTEHEHRQLIVQKLQTALKEHRCALVHGWQTAQALVKLAMGSHQLQRSRRATRTAWAVALAEATETLTTLRVRHEAHLSQLRERCRVARLKEATEALAAEESLVRRALLTEECAEMQTLHAAAAESYAQVLVARQKRSQREPDSSLSPFSSHVSSSSSSSYSSSSRSRPSRTRRRPHAAGVAPSQTAQPPQRDGSAINAMKLSNTQVVPAAAAAAASSSVRSRGTRRGRPSASSGAASEKKRKRTRTFTTTPTKATSAVEPTGSDAAGEGSEWTLAEELGLSSTAAASPPPHMSSHSTNHVAASYPHSDDGRRKLMSPSSCRLPAVHALVSKTALVSSAVKSAAAAAATRTGTSLGDVPPAAAASFLSSSSSFATAPRRSSPPAPPPPQTFDVERNETGSVRSHCAASEPLLPVMGGENLHITAVSPTQKMNDQHVLLTAQRTRNTSTSTSAAAAAAARLNDTETAHPTYSAAERTQSAYDAAQHDAEEREGQARREVTAPPTAATAAAAVSGVAAVGQPTSSLSMASSPPPRRPDSVLRRPTPPLPRDGLQAVSTAAAAAEKLFLRPRRASNVGVRPSSNATAAPPLPLPLPPPSRRRRRRSSEGGGASSRRARGPAVEDEPPSSQKQLPHALSTLSLLHATRDAGRPPRRVLNGEAELSPSRRVYAPSTHAANGAGSSGVRPKAVRGSVYIATSGESGDDLFADIFS